MIFYDPLGLKLTTLSSTEEEVPVEQELIVVFFTFCYFWKILSILYCLKLGLFWKAFVLSIHYLCVFCFVVADVEDFYQQCDPGEELFLSSS